MHAFLDDVPHELQRAAAGFSKFNLARIGRHTVGSGPPTGDTINLEFPNLKDTSYFVPENRNSLMKPQPLYLTVAGAALAVVAAWPAQAQESRVYRCGNNEYTNQVKGRTDCKRVEGGNVTILRGGPAPRAAPPGGAGPASAPQRVDAPEQRARDADAKTILETELRKAEAQQAELQKNYNNGQPDKQGDEARNYQKYLDRVAEMKAAIDRNQADIDGLKRELAHYGRAKPDPGQLP